MQLHITSGMKRGIGMYGKQRASWTMSRPVAPDYNIAMQQFTNMSCTTTNQHKDLPEESMKSDAADLDKMQAHAHIFWAALTLSLGRSCKWCNDRLCAWNNAPCPWWRFNSSPNTMEARNNILEKIAKGCEEESTVKDDTHHGRGHNIHAVVSFTAETDFSGKKEEF